MSAKKQLSAILLICTLLILQPFAALACSTCGCSELCPLGMVQETETEVKSKTSLSDSLWGSIILKMAYQRDPQLQKLARHLKGTNGITSGAIYTAAGGTLGQNVISLAVLNPAQGNDSYLPGGLGLGLSGLLNVALDGGILINWHLKKKIKARQLIIRQTVETIVNHLEYSDASCPDAQHELAKIIGERGAADCLKLWNLSHSQIASREQGKTTSMIDKHDSLNQDTSLQVKIKSPPLKLATSPDIN